MGGFLARAEALGDVLEARAAAAEVARQVPSETIADFQEAGFFRLLQPKRYGGHEAHPLEFYDVQMKVAERCPSSAWVLGVVGIHNWQLGLFDAQAQEEVWGADSSVLVSSSYMPVGKVARVEGGFRLSGRWSFSSGCDHCQWVFLGAFCPVEEGQPPDMRTFLLPKTDYEIVDTWHVMGLRGTGSKDIVVDDVFVPEHRTHKFIDGFFGKSPGNAINDAPLFSVPFGQLFVRSISTSVVGIAKGALRTYLEITRAKVSRADGAKVVEDPTAQRLAADCAATIDEVELVLRRDMGELMAAAEAGESVPLDRRVRFRLNSSRAADRLVKAVDSLYAVSGGGAIFDSHPLQRFYRDIRAARAHYANNPDKPAVNYGRVLLGLKNTDFFL